MDDDDGSENVGKEMNLRSFKLIIASIWTCSICQVQATFPGGRKIRRRMSTSSIKRQIRSFHVVVVQWTSKKCTKKRDARAELLF